MGSPLPHPVRPLFVAMLLSSLGGCAISRSGGGDARFSGLQRARCRAVLLVEPTGSADHERRGAELASAVVRVHLRSARTIFSTKLTDGGRLPLRDNASTRGAIRLHPDRPSRPLPDAASPGFRASASSWPSPADARHGGLLSQTTLQATALGLATRIRSARPPPGPDANSRAADTCPVGLLSHPPGTPEASRAEALAAGMH